MIKITPETPRGFNLFFSLIILYFLSESGKLLRNDQIFFSGQGRIDVGFRLDLPRIIVNLLINFHIRVF